MGRGSLLTFSTLTVTTGPDGPPLSLEFFPPGVPEAILCYAVPWGCSGLVVVLRASSSAHCVRTARGRP